MKFNKFNKEKEALFKKTVLRWHDSYFLCSLIIILMLGLLFFSMIGIYAANNNSDYNDYAWVAILLSLLIQIIIISLFIKLIKIYFYESGGDT